MLTLGGDIGGVGVHHGLTCFPLLKCVHLLYLRHLSLMTKMYGLLQLIIICTFTLFCYFH